MSAERVVPAWQVVRLAAPAASGAPLSSLPWGAIAPLPPLRRAEDGNAPRQSTRVRVSWHDAALLVRFDCEDPEPWATYRDRDAPLWEEEVVELFLAPGADDPSDYFEIEVNPLGALFDARIANPRLDRSELRADLSFDWPGIRWEVGESDGGWWAALELPWRGLPHLSPRPEVDKDLAAGAPGPHSRLWRANFYRVDRPRDGEPEHSAWSPTFVTPADFHRPRRFGHLRLVD